MFKFQLLETAFRLKFLSVILGFVNVILTVQYYEPESVFEVFLLANVSVAFAISVMYLCSVHYLGATYSLTVRKCDAMIHLVMGAITVAAWSIFLAFLIIGLDNNGSATPRSQCLITSMAHLNLEPQGSDKLECFSRIAFRTLLGVMCMINGVIYGSVYWVLMAAEVHQYELV